MRGPRRPVESSVATFLLGLLAFSPPILTVFDAEISIFKVPLLYLYLFAVWGLIICFVAWISDSGRREPKIELQEQRNDRAGAR